MGTRDNQDAIVLRGVVKSFRKSTIRNEYTTFKTELVRWLRGQREPRGPQQVRMIEVLRGVDLTIPRGKTVGIIGRNGSGKSTLLKLITGIYGPTAGTVEINGRISALLDLGAGFHPDFSGRENILINGSILGMTRAQIRERMSDIIAFSELGEFIDEPVRTYSSGMYMRLAFSVATHVDPDILIIDEILAVGDEHFSKKSLAKMMSFKEQGKTIVLVTHELSTLERWCDYAVWLDAGRVREFGAPAELIRHYRRAVELAQDRGLSMEAPALAPGGGALPSLDGQEVEAQRFPLELRAVRLVGHEGGKPVVDTEAGLTLEVDFRASEPMEGIDFAIELQHANGSLVYRTSTALEQVHLPQPLPPQGTLRFIVERIGLTAGEYVFQVSARSAGGKVPVTHPQTCPFTVRSALADEGILRPAHRWQVEAEAGGATGPQPRRVVS